jgi:hypothetical protein
VACLSFIVRQDMSDKKLPYFSRRGQEVILVLFALHEMGGIQRRRDVIDYISAHRWYEVIDEDLVPTRTSKEARYRIDLAWARKDSVLRDYVNNFERDAWELNRQGRDGLEKAIAAFRSGSWELGQCPFFTLGFKQIIDPTHEVKSTDKRRLRMIDILEFV